MPLIDQALREGPLSPAESAVLEVVSRNHKYIWSDSLDDLCEMARWATYPTLSKCPTLCPVSLQNESVVKGDSIQLTLNSRVTCYSGGGKNPPVTPTYTLRTVSNALNMLARTKRISAFELHGRRHYGSKLAYDTVKLKYDALPDEQRAEANFISEITFTGKNAKRLSE